jgi:hypothetical protein
LGPASRQGPPVRTGGASRTPLEICPQSNLRFRSTAEHASPTRKPCSTIGSEGLCPAWRGARGDPCGKEGHLGPLWQSVPNQIYASDEPPSTPRRTRRFSHLLWVGEAKTARLDDFPGRTPCARHATRICPQSSSATLRDCGSLLNSFRTRVAHDHHRGLRRGTTPPARSPPPRTAKTARVSRAARIHGLPVAEAPPRPLLQM